MGLKVHDNVLNEETRERLYTSLMGPGWTWGWKSNTKTDIYQFWHKHFAGHKKPNEEPDFPNDVSSELCGGLLEFWLFIPSLASTASRRANSASISLSLS